MIKFPDVWTKGSGSNVRDNRQMAWNQYAILPRQWQIHSDNKNTSKEYDNPLEAWSSYMTTMDIAGRRYIGNMLSKQGKNRYTGENSKGENHEEAG